jgi:uncharacterized protein (TIGR00296 family)
MDSRDGKRAVRIARKAIEEWVRNRKKLVTRDYPHSFEEKRGVFVTLHTYPDRGLRGCIGFPEPVHHLINGIIEAAVHACEDPRFPSLSPEELDRIIIEVSVLTKPEPLKVPPAQRPKAIKRGKDGLIIRSGFHSGLLLPQVATEHKMTSEEFIMAACTKAILPPDAWKDGGTEVFTFQCDVFSEKKPGVV